MAREPRDRGVQADDRGVQADDRGIQADQMRRMVPVIALVVAVLAILTDGSDSAVEVLAAAIPVAAFATWAVWPHLPLSALAFGVIVPVLVAQRGGALEPTLFEVSLLAFVVAGYANSLGRAIALGAAALAAPVAIAVVQDPTQITVGVWLVGVAFPWAVAYMMRRQEELSAALEASRRELARQTLAAERRRIARDVHDFVGHGLAGMMLQITSARHVLRRDPEAAEEALRSAEDVGRMSMRELRRTVALLRSDEDGSTAPLPSVLEVPALVDHARASGLAVELTLAGDLARVDPSVGVAVYRIAQEALANAARHAPRARTLVRLDASNEEVILVAETTGAPHDAVDHDPERPRYGLIGMRERATALGGTFSATRTGHGFRVSCSLPLAAAEEEARASS